MFTASFQKNLVSIVSGTRVTVWLFLGTESAESGGDKPRIHAGEIILSVSELLKPPTAY